MVKEKLSLLEKRSINTAILSVCIGGLRNCAPEKIKEYWDVIMAPLGKYEDGNLRHNVWYAHRQILRKRTGMGLTQRVWEEDYLESFINSLLGYGLANVKREREKQWEAIKKEI